MLTNVQFPQTISFASSASYLYGQQVPLSTRASSGLPVTFSLISGPASLVGNILTMTGIGKVTVVAMQAGNSTYAAASPVDQVITVNPAPLTVTVGYQTKVYGATPPPTFQYTGFVNGDTSASLTTQPTVSGVTSASHVSGSPYTVASSGAVDPNYAFTYATSKMTVTPAALTITDNQTKAYGASPVLTFQCIGLVNGDTSASLTTQPTVTTTATAASHVGTTGRRPAARPIRTIPSPTCRAR